MKKYILAALAGLCVQAQAFFTLDFAAYNGTNITAGSPLTIFVSGYGDVIFSTTGANVISINTSYAPGVSAAIQPSEVLFVTFAGDYAPTNIDEVSFGFNGLSGADGLVITPLDATTISLQMGSGGNGAGLRDVTFAAIPEPSTTALGALGVLALALRRRRAC
jgi:hypothetical protein